MAKFEIGLQQFWGFALVLVRTGGILSAFPIIGSRMVPIRIRAAMALVLTLAFGPLVAPTLAPDWLEPVKLTIGLATELIIGLFLGFATRLLMAAVEIAGSIMGFQLGFGVAVQLDPVTQVETPVLGSFFGDGGLASLFCSRWASHVAFGFGIEFRLDSSFRRPVSCALISGRC